MEGVRPLFLLGAAFVVVVFFPRPGPLTKGPLPKEPSANLRFCGACKILCKACGGRCGPLLAKQQIL